MDVLRELIQQNKTQQYWQKEETLLLAVSGGIDSVVLLDLFLRLPSAFQPNIAVAHVNHQLRKESEIEESYLRSFCQERNIPFHTKRWQAGVDIQKDIENQARTFRYDFFYEVMTAYEYDSLVTAHHGDDQAETVLMRLLKGATLQSVTGIKSIRSWQEKKVIRPLLHFSKEEIRQYGEDHSIVYFEDSSNMSNEYLRNRFRHHIIPEMKGENPNFLNHIHTFVKQLTYANDIVEARISEIFPNIISKKHAECWRIDREKFLTCTESEQYMLLVQLWQVALVEKNVEVNAEQLQQVWSILQNDKPQQKINMKSHWVFQSVYKQAYLLKVKPDEAIEEKSSFQLSLQEGIMLSSSEWIGLFVEGEKTSIPREFVHAQEYEIQVTSTVELPLYIRKRLPGDKLVFNEKGQHKKIKKILIDHKITNEARKKSWVITDSGGKILWLAPVKESYLSIPQETDKIQYRLIYLRNERDLEGELYVKKGH